MTDQDETIVVTEEKHSKWRWIGTSLKVLFVIAAIMLIGMAVLANMGGSSDALKQSVEEFISESTSYDAKIEKFNSMKFFPEISVDFENTKFFNKDGVDPVMLLAKAKISLSFWDVMFANGRIKSFNVEGFEALAGTLLDVPLSVETLAIVEDDQGPRLEGKGMINQKSAFIAFTMESLGVASAKKYTFGSERGFDITLGEIKIAGKMTNAEKSKVSFENIEVSVADKKILSGNLQIQRNKEKIMIGGLLNIEENHTDVTPAIEIILPHEGQPLHIDGDIKSANFNVRDFAAESGYDRLMTAVTETFGQLPPVPAHEIKFDAGSVYNGPLPLDGWRIDADAIAKGKP